MLFKLNHVVFDIKTQSHGTVSRITPGWIHIRYKNNETKSIPCRRSNLVIKSTTNIIHSYRRYQNEFPNGSPAILSSDQTGPPDQTEQPDTLSNSCTGFQLNQQVFDTKSKTMCRIINITPTWIKVISDDKEFSRRRAELEIPSVSPVNSSVYLSRNLRYSPIYHIEEQSFSFLKKLKCYGQSMRQKLSTRVQYKVLQQDWIAGNDHIHFDVRFKDDNNKWIEQFLVKDSIGRGRGLYANREFVADEIITIYAGIVRSSTYLASKEYTAKIGEKLIDANSENFFFAKFINSDKDNFNCQLTPPNDNDFEPGRIVATCDIKKGDEILMNYHKDLGI